MKAITIQQPWAILIALGLKNYETRSWQTKHRGSLAIHAGKTVDKEAFEWYWIKSVLKAHGITSIDQLPTGSVIATARLVDCHKTKVTTSHAAIINVNGSDRLISGDEVAFGDYSPGRFAWELADVTMLLEPVPVKGQLSLWEWDGERHE